MIKRSFRFGLVVGLLGGLALALVKAFGGRDEAPPTAPAAAGGSPSRSTPWPRLEGDPAVPARPQERLVADPDAPAAPVPEPEPVHQPAAMAPAPAAPAPAPAPASPTSTTKAARVTPPPPEAPTTAAKKASKKAAKKATKKKSAPRRAWVEPDGDVCPTSHPVKAKLASKIFHVPGGLSYGRTRPDRCYRDEAAAESDGLRPAKR